MSSSDLSLLSGCMSLAAVGRGVDELEGDETIQLKVGNRLYRVSKSRLSLRSPFFRGLFQLLKVGEGDRTPISLEVKEPEWLAYLWFIHADPLAWDIFSTSPASTEKCARLLGLVLAAQLFLAVEVAQWAVDEALGMLTQPGRAFYVDAELARLLLSVASCYRGSADCTITTICQDVVCDALHPNRPGELSEDPIRALEAARGNNFVLAHIYFYILLKGQNYDWKRDIRMRPVDRVRLLCGNCSLLHQKSGARRTFPELTHSRPASSSPSGVAQGRWAALWATYPLLSSLNFAAKNVLQAAYRAPRRQVTAPWGPVMDARIATARGELWEHFDEQLWDLGL
ncbi:hypothetical protein AURDEDRAFT_178099 [Auricularia subglabra TFB-10046 SS5]|uniref:BTB domain-containing protein n=1 Tax=Auricularia subglabra (strain TFB-10046 / SS5) TaxID=717982 RepID=J0CRB7_AURST|nr:hypothetical protein AURDEDRAFT_178099 [Auricularia subglabra TFB-10046 SS5]